MHRPGGHSRSDTVKLIAAVALTLGFVLAFPASAFASFWSLTYLIAAFAMSGLFALLLAPAASCWWLLIRRSPAIRASD
jgi:hypothetical protein